MCIVFALVGPLQIILIAYRNDLFPNYALIMTTSVGFMFPIFLYIFQNNFVFLNFQFYFSSAYNFEFPFLLFLENKYIYLLLFLLAFTYNSIAETIFQFKIISFWRNSILKEFSEIIFNLCFSFDGLLLFLFSFLFFLAFLFLQFDALGCLSQLFLKLNAENIVASTTTDVNNAVRLGCCSIVAVTAKDVVSWLNCHLFPLIFTLTLHKCCCCLTDCLPAFGWLSLLYCGFLLQFHSLFHNNLSSYRCFWQLLLNMWVSFAPFLIIFSEFRKATLG